LDVATLTSWWVVLSGATTVVLVPLAIYIVRYYWDRRRWHVLERLIRTWASQELLGVPDDLTDDDWNALAAMMLNEAGFEPAKIKDFIELGVWFAKGLASLEVRGRI